MLGLLRDERLREEFSGCFFLHAALCIRWSLSRLKARAFCQGLVVEEMKWGMGTTSRLRFKGSIVLLEEGQESAAIDP